MSKRFVLFVKQPLSAEDTLAIKVLQEGGPALHAHVSVFAVTSENQASLPDPLPEQLRQTATPLLFDIVTSVVSKNARGVLQSMARRIKAIEQSQPAAETAPAISRHTPKPQPQPQLQPTPSASASRTMSTALDLGDGYGQAQQTEAASLLETRGSIGGQGFAGSGFSGGGMSSRGCRLDDDWNTATINWNEEAASRYMHDAFGSGPDIGTTDASMKMATDRGERNAEKGKLKGDEDAEVVKLIESREQLDRQFKERQQRGGMAPGSTLMTPPQSREERLAGVEGMMALRPLTNVPVKNPGSLASMSAGSSQF